MQAEKPKHGKKDRPLCAHCGLLGHTKDKCYKLHGYPPGYTPLSKRGKTQIVPAAMENQVTDYVSTKAPTNASTMTSSQCLQLINFLQAHMAQSSVSNFGESLSFLLGVSLNVLNSIFDDKLFTWIIDSGATANIVHTLECSK